MLLNIEFVRQPARLNVCERNSERVCRVVRLGYRLQTEVHLHHLLNLLFVRSTVARHCLLDL